VVNSPWKHFVRCPKSHQMEIVGIRIDVDVNAVVPLPDECPRRQPRLSRRDVRRMRKFLRGL